MNNKSSKNNKRNSSSKIVVRRPRMVPNQKPRLRVPRTLRPSGMSKYRMALIDPFDDWARDVRLPNDFAVPTITRTISGFCTLGAGLKPSAYLFTPSPVVSAYSPSGTLPQADYVPYNNFNQVYQSIDQATLRTNFASWRLVAGGIRIKSAMSATATPIVVSIATAPVVGSGPGPNFLNDGGPQTETGLANILSDIIGIAPSITATGIGGWGSAINGLSNFNRFTTQDVTTQTLTVPFRVTDPRAFDFKSSLSNTGRGYAANTTILDQVIINATTGAVNAALTDNEENFQFEGFTAIAIDVKNVAFVNPSVLEIEYIYHLEGLPSGNNNTTKNAITSGSSVVETATHLGDVAWANRHGLYKIASAMSGTLFNKVDPELIGHMLGLRL